MQALDGRDGLALEDEGIPHRFHSEHPDLVRDQARENLMFETPKMCVHDVQWHLHGVKAEFVGRSDLQLPEVAIKLCGLVAPKTAAAAADFRNKRLLTVTSFCLGGSNRLVSSTIRCINVLPWAVRW